MATSTARVAANRQNALKSTGPKTAAGKAASRLNAFQHGMSGAGDLLGPGEDARLVAERAAAFASELGAAGASGLLLARRAAILSVRMERLAEGELIAVRAAERQAHADFDADRTSAIAELIAEAEDPTNDPAEALAALAACPDGLGRLLVAWREVRARLGAADAGEAGAMATRWLGSAGAAGAGPPADLTRRVDAEVGRLETLAGSMGGAARAIDRARVEAGVLARLDPGPAAALARRYEAAAERGMYRAIRTIAAINRQAGRTAASPPPALAELRSSLDQMGMGPRPPAPPAGRVDRPAAARLASFGAAGAEPLASFRAGVAPAPGAAMPLDPASPEARKRRPDIGQIDRRVAAGRR